MESTNERKCERIAKWGALVDDEVISSPGHKVSVAVLKDQRGLNEEHVLVRDHNSPDDTVLEDSLEIDLSEGNVFYSIRRCDLVQRRTCAAPAKLAWIVDDRPEITVRPEQTGEMLRRLFRLPAHSQISRDFRSPDDAGIGDEETILFLEGPVFYTRERNAELKITVNARIFTEHDGVKGVMTGQEIAQLVYPENPRAVCIWLTSNGSREIGLDESISIKGCESFDVVRKGVTGGFETSRIELEVKKLRASGAKVEFIPAQLVVIFQDLHTRPGLPINLTDVLVKVPSSYPGQMLDGAFLPEGSPLIGRVKGSPQNTFETALGKRWQLVSYHPHNGGGGPQWNPAQHGFHTYLGELLSWLYDAQ